METKYSLLDANLNSIPENEVISDSDLALIENYQINKNFKPGRDYIEGHIYSVTNELLYSNYEVNIPFADQVDVSNKGLSQLSINPSDFTIQSGFEYSDVKTVFHFLKDLYTVTGAVSKFYIDKISSDRKEILLGSTEVSLNSIINTTGKIKKRFTEGAYLEEIYLNLGGNDLLIVTNIDVYEQGSQYSVALKLYEPLPTNYSLKQSSQLVEKLSDSIAVRVDVTITEDDVITPKLRSANFNVEVDSNTSVPTEYLTYDELISFDSSNSNKEVLSYLEDKSVELNIDYSDLSNYIHFSSAVERLENFKYKVSLLESYENALVSISNVSTQTTHNNKYNNLIQGVLNNFDHYEKHLYFKSGSTSWPKTSSAKPYTNSTITSTEATTWFSSSLETSSNFDSSNYDMLSNTLPSYIGEDSSNRKGVLFVHMIAHHFDNLWTYTKSVSDKYDNDNRLDYGISKDMVREALTSFGVKLYNSKEGSNDLFKYLIEDTYSSGSSSEIINTFVTPPGLPVNSQPVSRTNYEGELYKRIYHNLPYLLKAKGTERGLRALINCFGIPSSFLHIKQFGGSLRTNELIGPDHTISGSLDKIRIDSSTSGSVGDVLSRFTTVSKEEVERVQDIHRIEVGFSPADSIDKVIQDYTGSIKFDDLIGDPRDLHKHSYSTYDPIQNFDKIRELVLGSHEKTEMKDFVRILKFYDNVLFKMIKDFVPAKSSLDTGIIIKPHLLERNKIKSPSMEISTLEHEGQIDTAFTTGSHGGAYGTGSTQTTTQHSIIVPTILGSTIKPISDESPMYNGELSGSSMVITNGELNNLNVFKKDTPPQLRYKLTVVTQDTDTLTQFYMWPGSEETSPLACTLTSADFPSTTPGTYYHNGPNAIPMGGDYVFTDINATNTFNGLGEWWKVTSVAGAGAVYLISGSGADQGKIAYLDDCTLYDSTAPTGYTATWDMSPKQINASNYTAVPFIIHRGEIGNTYTATAYLSGSSSTTVTATGTITSSPSTILSNAGTIDTTGLADGSNVVLEVVLTDSAGNAGIIAPVVLSSEILNSSLIALTKSVNGPSGYTVKFKTSNTYSTDQTLNTDGNFWLKLENIPSSTTGVAYISMVSTGGGTTYTQQRNYNGSSASFLNISIHNIFHSLNNGTVTVTAYLIDSAGNQGANVTDTVSLSVSSGNLSPSTTTITQYGGSQTHSVSVQPSNLTWSLTTSASWVTITGASNSGNDTNINVQASYNSSQTSRTATLLLKNSSGNILDFSNFTQNGNNCVDPTTQILIGDGTTISAQDLKVGQEIRTKDEITLEWTLTRVIKVQRHDSRKVKVVFEEGELVCSPDHRVYVDNKSSYLAVKLLEDGDIISGKAFISVAEQPEGDVIEISIEKAHTYISNGILSHNVKIEE
jgi:hypothetical protein